MDYQPAPNGKDPQLWHIARKRASFKSHLVTYLVVNAGLWIIWYFTGERNDGGGLPWPAWSMLGWGIGVASHYASAYMNTGENSVEKEYDKLTQKQFK
jgi:hypothetical protein